MAEMRIPDADRVGIASSSLSVDAPKLGGLTTPQKKVTRPAAAKPGSSVPKRWSSMQGTPDYIADLAGRTGYLSEDDSRYWANQFSVAAGYKDDTPENAQRKVGIYEKLVRAISKDAQQGYMPRELAQNLISSAALAAGEIKRAQAGRAEAERLGPLGQAKEAALFQLQDISRENIAPTLTSGIAAEALRGRRVPAREVLETTAGKIGAGAAGLAVPIAEIIAASAAPTAALGVTPLAPAAPVLGPLIGAGIQAVGGQASRGLAQRARLGRAQERVRELSQALLKDPSNQDTQNQLYEAIAVAEEASKGVTPITEAAKQVLASVGSAFAGGGAIRGLTAGVRAITPALIGSARAARIASQIRPSVRAAFNPAAESTVGSVAGTLAQTGIAEGRFATPEELGFGLGVGGALGAASVRSAAKSATLVDNLANALRSSDTAALDAAIAALDKANVRGKQRQRIIDAAAAKAQTPPPAPQAAPAAPQAAPQPAPQPAQQVWTGAALLDPNRGPVTAGDRVSLPNPADPTQQVGGEVVFVDPGENFLNVRFDSGEVRTIPARSTSTVSQPESILGASRPVGPQPAAPAVKFGDVKAGTAQPKLGENMEIMLDGNRVESWRVVGMDVDGGYTLERGGRKVRLDANAADPMNVTSALQETGAATATPAAGAAQAPSSLQPADVPAIRARVEQGGGYIEYVDAKKGRRNIVYLSAYDPNTDRFSGYYAQDPKAALSVSSADLAGARELSFYDPYAAESAALAAAKSPQEIDAALSALDQKSRTEIAAAAARSPYVENQARAIADNVIETATKTNPEIKIGMIRRGLLRGDEEFVKEFDPLELPANLPADLAAQIQQKYQQGVETIAQRWVNAANDPRVALMPDQAQKDALIGRIRTELLDALGKPKSPARASVEARIAQLAPQAPAPARAGRQAPAPTAAAAPEPVALSDEARAYIDAETRGDTAEASRIYNASANPDALNAEVRRARTAPVTAPAPAAPAPAPKPAASAPAPEPVTSGAADLVAQTSPSERKLFIRMMNAVASNNAREKAEYDAFLAAQQQDPDLAARFDAFLELSEVDDNLLKIPQNVQEAPIPGYAPAAPSPAAQKPPAPAPVVAAPAPVTETPAAAPKPAEAAPAEPAAAPVAETTPAAPSPDTVYTVGGRRYRVISRRSDKWEVEAVTPTGKTGARTTVDANSGIAQQIKMADAKAEPTDTRVYDIPTRGGVKRYQVLNEDGDKWLVQEFDAQGQPVKGPTTLSADSPYAGIIRSERTSAAAEKSAEPETVAKRLATLYRQALRTEDNEKALADIEKQAADSGVEMAAVVAAAEAQGPLPVARPYKDVSPEDLVRRIVKADKEWEDTSKEPSLARRESMKRGIESRRRAMEKELQTRGDAAVQALKQARDADVARLKQAEAAAKKAAAAPAPAAPKAAAPTVSATVTTAKAAPVQVVQAGKKPLEEQLIEKYIAAFKNNDAAAMKTVDMLIETNRLNGDKLRAEAVRRIQAGGTPKPAAPKPAPKPAAPKPKGVDKGVQTLKGKDANLDRIQSLGSRFGWEAEGRPGSRADMSEDELAELANLLQNPTPGVQAVLQRRGPKWVEERIKRIQEEAGERGAAREARFRDAVAEFEQARKVVAETAAPETRAPEVEVPAPEVKAPAPKTEPAPPTEAPAGAYEAANEIAERAKKAVRGARDELQAIKDAGQRSDRVDEILKPFYDELEPYSMLKEVQPVIDDLLDTRVMAVANKKSTAPVQTPPPAPKTVQKAVEQAPVITPEGKVIEQPRQQNLFANKESRTNYLEQGVATDIEVPSSVGPKRVDVDMVTFDKVPHVFLPKASGGYFRPKPIASVDDPVLKAALLDVVERLRAIKTEASEGTRRRSAEEIEYARAERINAELEQAAARSASEAAYGEETARALKARIETGSRQQRLFGLAFGGATLATAMPADASPLMGVMPNAILSLPDIGHVVSNPGAAVAGIVGTAVVSGVLASLRKAKKAGGFGPWFRDFVANSPEFKGYWNTLSDRFKREVLSNTKGMWDRALSLIATPSRAIGGATNAATQFGWRELGEGLAEGLKLKDAAYNDFMAYFDKGLLNAFKQVRDLQLRPRAAKAAQTIMDGLANNDAARKTIPEIQALTSVGDLLLPLKMNEMVSKLRQGDKAARQMYNNFGAYLDARYPTTRDQEALWEFFSRREQDLTPRDKQRFAEFLADDNLRVIRRAIDELADLNVQTSGLSAGAAAEYRGRYIRTFGLRGRDKADLIGRLADMLSFSERRGSAFAGGQKGEYRGITKSDFGSEAARDTFVADRNRGWVITNRFTRKSGTEDVAFARLEDINGNIREIEESDLPNWNTEGYAKWRRFTDDDGNAKAIRDLTLPELKNDGYKIDLTAAARNTLMSMSKQKTRNMLAASIAADPDLSLSGRTADDLNQSWGLRRWGQNAALGVFEWTGNRVGDQFEVVSVGTGQRALVNAKRDANGNIVGFAGEFARSKDNNFASASNFAPAVLFDGKRWEVVRVGEKNGKVVYDIRRDGNTVQNVEADRVRKFRMLSVPERVRTSTRGIGAFLPGEFNYGQLNDTFVSPDVYATVQGLVKGSLLKRGVDVLDSSVFGNRLWKMGVVGQNIRSAVTQMASNIVAASELGVGVSELPYAAKKVITDRAEMQRLEAAGLFADLGSTQQTGVTRLTNQADFQKWTANDSFKRMQRQFLSIPEDERTIGDYVNLIWHGVVQPRGAAAFRAIPGIIQFQDQVARYAIYDRLWQNNMANGMNPSAASEKAVEDTLAMVFRTDTHPLVTVASKTVLPWANVTKYTALTAPVVAALNPFNYFQTKLQMGILGAVVGAFDEDEPVEVTDLSGKVKQYTSAQIRRMVADRLRPELAKARYTWTGVPKDVRLNIPGIGTVVLNTEKFDPASNEFWADFGGRPVALIQTMGKLPALLRGDKGSLRDVLTTFAAHRGYLPPVTDETPLREEVRDGMKALVGAFAPMGMAAGRVVSPTRAQQDRATAALMFLVSATKYNPSETLRQIDGYTFGETEALRQAKNAAVARTADEKEQMAIREDYDKRIDNVNRAAEEYKILINALVAQDEKQGLVGAGAK